MITGLFEIHITLEPSNKNNLPFDFSDNPEIKLTRIQLSKGNHPVQDMVTLQFKGSEATATYEAFLLKSYLIYRGFKPVRIKIEADVRNQNIPLENVDVLDNNYFEHHVKVLLNSDFEANQLRELLKEDAHTSRNPRKVRPDGRHERFVNQRSCLGYSGSSKKFDDLVSFLNKERYTILSAEREFVCFDSNLDLDTGWMVSK